MIEKKRVTYWTHIARSVLLSQSPFDFGYNIFLGVHAVMAHEFFVRENISVRYKSVRSLLRIFKDGGNATYL
jgi:hypothetical protein